MSEKNTAARKGILGAIAGDIVGSRFEFDNYRAKDFDLFGPGCFATDDSIMTLAVARALCEADGDTDVLARVIAPVMQRVGRPYPHSGYGGRFYGWMYSDHPKPYHSFGNGAAMRVSPVAYAASSLDEVKELSRIVTAVTHDHPEGLKGAEATAVAAFMARTGASKDEIRALMERDYYRVGFTIDEMRPVYEFDETCQRTMPVALAAFYEAADYEDAVRTAVSVGGDSDTIAAIAGAIAGAYWGVPEPIGARALTYLDSTLLGIYSEFHAKYE